MALDHGAGAQDAKKEVGPEAGVWRPHIPAGPPPPVRGWGCPTATAAAGPLFGRKGRAVYTPALDADGSLEPRENAISRVFTRIKRRQELGLVVQHRHRASTAGDGQSGEDYVCQARSRSALRRPVAPVWQRTCAAHTRRGCPLLPHVDPSSPLPACGSHIPCLPCLTPSPLPSPPTHTRTYASSTHCGTRARRPPPHTYYAQLHNTQ